MPPGDLLADSLPEPLPTDPLVVAAAWLADAWQRRDQPNPNAMVLATSTPSGEPSARIVLCKSIEPQPGCVRFVSNYHSRKGRDIAANPRVALVLHWDHSHRQVRLEGIVTRASEQDSDAYFATRAWGSRLGAHASEQSEPIASRAALDARLNEQRERYGATEAQGLSIPRPPHWGGYVVWIDTAELWVEGHARLHDRALYMRRLTYVADGSFSGGPWTATRLQP
jgi:pyridoxamine 5'-phosphate oxidase